MGIEFVDFFFETVFLIKGAGGFLDSLFVGSHFRLDDFHFVGVAKPTFNAVKTGRVDTVVHQDVMILDVRDSALFDARLLPYDRRYKEHEREYRDEHCEIDLPRFLSDSDGFLDSLHRRIGREIINLFSDSRG